ncbi:recombination mediator RecR [Brackiella oedipodis]|uniref:recombination mediator RecR n=1 Tax=Brackiella oedipodis TaxID=124225 RepID=UPI00048E583B|nr:recombination mediator RecR [Brackiella oedipodis]
MVSKPNTKEPLEELLNSLCKLPGVGQRTARRMAYHLLQNDRDGAQAIANSISHALNAIKHCQYCNNFSLDDVCHICSNQQRDPSLLCVVETPADLNMIENSHSYKGLYYVLMGRVEPMAGVGAQQLQIQRLLKRAQDGIVKEVILATNYTTEGETTAHYISDLLRSHGLKVTRIARGVPAGSELEYVDAGTIAWAFMDRRSEN